MKLVFFGTPEFAIPTLKKIYNSKHKILCVVTTPDKKSGRGLNYKQSPIKKLAINYNLPVLDPIDMNNIQFIQKLKNLKADVFVVVAFKILPKHILDIPKIYSINLHASLLPKYRGSSPINYAILNGEKITGLSTFILEKKIDHGNILLQEEIKINNEINFGELSILLSNKGSLLILKTLERIENKNIIPLKQDNKNITYAPKIVINRDCKINWDNTSTIIHNQIRAFSPKPGAFTKFKDKRVKLFSSEINNSLLKNKLEIGEIQYEDPFILIGTKNGSLYIKEIQLEGKSKCNAKDFILGNSKFIGEKFE